MRNGKLWLLPLVLLPMTACKPVVTSKPLAIVAVVQCKALRAVVTVGSDGQTEGVDMTIPQIKQYLEDNPQLAGPHQMLVTLPCGPPSKAEGAPAPNQSEHPAPGEPDGLNEKGTTDTAFI